MTRFLLIGAGYSARAFAKLAKADGAAVAGTTRSPDRLDALRAEGIEPLVFDGALSPALRAELARATHIVSSAAPSEAGDPFLNAAQGLGRAEMPALRWIGYLSTVGVYGNHHGAWVTEDSECRPRPGRNAQRVEAERAWQTFAGRIETPLAILRLSGIYGPGQNTLVNLARGTARRIIKPGQFFNRIHVDDIAGALQFLSANDANGIFNVTDDEPAPPQDVIEFAAGLMGVEPPPEIDFATAEMTPMARSFYGDTKRVSNARLKAMGFALRRPNYRTAFSDMWASDSWR